MRRLLRRQRATAPRCSINSALETLTAPALRRIILEQSKRANVGHIGSALSVVDIVCALYDQVLRIPEPADPDRDRFIMSKGHAVLALYGALHLRGWISAEDLETYAGDGTLLGITRSTACKESTSRRARSATACPWASGLLSLRASSGRLDASSC